MPRKKPITASECIDPAAVLAPQIATIMAAGQQPLTDAIQAIADVSVDLRVTMKYSPEDMEKLDQFAIGLLRDGTGAYEANNAGLAGRIRDAYLRAEVMLTIRKEIAALEV